MIFSFAIWFKNHTFYLQNRNAKHILILLDTKGGPFDEINHISVFWSWITIWLC
jgi:hypothetical protein